MTDKITKFIDSLDSKTRRRLKEKLFFLKANPYKMLNVKRLDSWGENVYRLRVGKIRIIDIDYRGNIY